MADQRLILKRGVEADGIKNATTVRNGELWFAADTKKLFVGWDGESFEVAQIVEAKDGKLFADIPQKPFYLPLAIKPYTYIDTCRFCGAEGTFPDVCVNTRDMEDYAIEDKDGVRGERCYAALVKQGGGEKGLKYVELNRFPPPPTTEKEEEIQQKENESDIEDKSKSVEVNIKKDTRRWNPEDDQDRRKKP